MEGGGLGLFRDGEATTKFQFPTKGEYIFRVCAPTANWPGRSCRSWRFRVEWQGSGSLRGRRIAARARVMKSRATLEAGEHTAGGRVSEQLQRTRTTPTRSCAATAMCSWIAVEIKGPPVASAAVLPESHRRLIDADCPRPGRKTRRRGRFWNRLPRALIAGRWCRAEVERLVAFVDLAMQRRRQLPRRHPGRRPGRALLAAFSFPLGARSAGHAARRRPRI